MTVISFPTVFKRLVLQILYVKTQVCLGKEKTFYVINGNMVDMWCFLVITNPFPEQAPFFMCLQEKSIENTVGKGEIACNAKILLSPQSFLTLWKFLPFTSNMKLSSLKTLSVW